MHILLTNDDGIFSDGLTALYRQMVRNHSVTVIAPDRERSAVGHGITLHQPLRAKRIRMDHGGRCYAVNGTPADCIKLGVLELMNELPDLVVSGINPGANIGINAHYSGTVAAAREATLYRLKAVAVSVDYSETIAYAEIAEFIDSLAEKVVRNEAVPGTFFNINVPSVSFSRIRGIRVTRQGTFSVIDGFEKRVDPRNRTYYWQKVSGMRSDMAEDMDGYALEEHCISITPMTCDMTDYDAIHKMKDSGLFHLCGREE
jgi:5'-nucleotidase